MIATIYSVASSVQSITRRIEERTALDLFSTLFNCWFFFGYVSHDICWCCMVDADDRRCIFNMCAVLSESSQHDVTSRCWFFFFFRKKLYSSLLESIRGIKLSLNGYGPWDHNVICKTLGICFVWKRQLGNCMYLYLIFNNNKTYRVELRRKWV